MLASLHVWLLNAPLFRCPQFYFLSTTAQFLFLFDVSFAFQCVFDVAYSIFRFRYFSIWLLLFGLPFS